MNGIDFYKEAVDRLEEIVKVFEQELDKPKFAHSAYTYENPTVKHVCFLKSIRIIGGLNALLVLLEAGYATEMGVLMRTISDCINAIYFLLESHPEPSYDAKKYISNFFSENIEDVELAPDQNRRIHRTKVKKIHASRARLLSEYINFSVGRDMVYKNYSAYSGYVHSAFPNIMETYTGQPDEKFLTHGMKGSARIKEWEKILANFIRSSMLVFGYMAEQYEKVDLIHTIRKTMGWFEKRMSELHLN
ncbi:MAG: hypothetical protein ACYSWP_01315 [Planctomycetota bacterium]|jgi:hypothetical protein